MALDYLRQYARQTPETSATEAVAVDTTPLEQLIPGEMISRGGSSCFVAHSTYAASDRHGLHTLSSLSDVSTDRLAILARDPELAFADLHGAVFLDTETTGLSMGAGTYVFLVGAGYFDGQEFHVRQFFLRSPGEEDAFLFALDEFLRRFSVVVTFNGKAFDWPLLENRFVRQRDLRRPPLEDPPHLDLLHPARRMWKRRLESCALSSLEKNILSVARTHEDVPGWQIPSLYFQYLRTGDAGALQGVFYHNLHDILSLATLMIHFDQILADPMGGLVRECLDFYCLGKMFERVGESDYAIACFDESLRRADSQAAAREPMERLAGIHKRERRWDSALHFWDRLVDDGGPGALGALVERAKFYEHVERDYLEALDDVQRALLLLEMASSPRPDIDRRDLEHRRARLLNRVYRHRSWVSSER